MTALVALSAMLAPQMPTLSADLAQRAMQAFPGLKADQIAFGYFDLGTSSRDGYNLDVPMYPASVVKMFYLARTEELLATKKIIRNPEFDRALKDMIVESNNDATGLILDTITGTTGGPELSPKELEKWMSKRQSVNKWLESIGIRGVNCSQKTWNEGPYGRERQGYGPNFELRNSLTVSSCLKLMELIQTKKLTGSEEMLALLSRKPGTKDGQVADFIGELAPTTAKLWSKAGWTSTVRHDVACLERDGQKRIYCVFTRFDVQSPKLLQFIAGEMLKW